MDSSLRGVDDKESGVLRPRALSEAARGVDVPGEMLSSTCGLTAVVTSGHRSVLEAKIPSRECKPLDGEGNGS